jgi:pyruvate dehydrogenase E2 component (dihydrolipoamide acetyltransferase)
MKVFKLPDLGEGLQEAEIVEWHVRSGEEVRADQPLLSVETAKAIVEIPSPQTGRIAKLFGQPGDVVHLGASLVAFEGEGDEADAGTVVGHMEVGQHVVQEAPAVPGGGIGASAGVIKAIPAARALARKLDVDLAMVTPSGPEGVITAADVQRVAKVLAELGSPEVLRGVRRAMAQNMARAQSEVAAATVIDDADIHACGRAWTS